MSLRIIIQNYKSVRNAHIDLRPGLNILIGPNGSGKTCLLSALNFLRDVFRVGAAQALARQGGYRRVYHREQTRMSFSFISPYGERTYRRVKIPCEFHWKIDITQAGPEKIATIIHESIKIVGNYKGRQVRLFSINLDRKTSGKQKTKLKRFLCPSGEFGRNLFSFWEEEYINANKANLARITRDKIRETLSRSRIKNEPDRSFFPTVAQFDVKIYENYINFLYLNEYNILPDVARASTEQLPFAQMTPNGQAVSEVIYALENQHYHKLEQLYLIEFEDTYEYMYKPWIMPRYLYKMRRKPRFDLYVNALENINRELSAAVKPITKVSVDTDPTNGRRFVVFKSENDTFYPEEVSDGTIKWLCILVSVFVPFSRVYLLEEPENFMHPWMQQRLISIMREQSKLKGTIFLLSSHSATILNSALPEEILVVKHTNRKGTQISAMKDLDKVKQVLSQSDFHLGDLWVSGAIGGIPTDE